MKCRKNLWFQGAALLLIAITVLLAPGAVAQSKYKTLHTFKAGKDAEGAYAGLIFDQKGNLYGTEAGGGNQNNGTVFKLAPNTDGSWTESVIYSFLGGEDGRLPYASLIFDQKGNLYGTTGHGGTGDNGTAFTLTPNADGSWTESVLYRFLGGKDGALPGASLIMDPAGNLYGTTIYGNGGNSGRCLSGECGVVFELMPNADGTWTESLLYRFRGGKDGGNPEAGLIFDEAEICTALHQTWAATAAPAVAWSLSSRGRRTEAGWRVCSTDSVGGTEMSRLLA